MKTIWKIYDNQKSKVLDKSYNSEKEAEEAMTKIIRVKQAARESHDLKVFEAGHIVSHDDIYNLQCDLDRLEHFKNEENMEKVQEYLELIANHIKDLLNESE